MGRHRKSKFLKVRAKVKDIVLGFLLLHKQAFLHPLEFSKKASKKKKNVSNLSFFLVNLFIATLIFSVVRLFPFQNHFSVAFISFESILRYTVWLCIVLLLILVINVLAKTLQGQTNLKMTANSIFLLSVPVVFLGVRFLQPFAFFYLCALFILGFKHAFKFSYTQAAFVTLIPAISFVVMLWLLEFVSFSPLFWLHF